LGLHSQGSCPAIVTVKRGCCIFGFT